MDWRAQREDYSHRSLDHNPQTSYFDPNPSFSSGWRLCLQTISEEDARICGSCQIYHMSGVDRPGTFLTRLTVSYRWSLPRLLKLLETNRGPDCTCAADGHYSPPYALL